jgi:ABC-type Fe3+-hydroxamate transport system substrate-binding protein
MPIARRTSSIRSPRRGALVALAVLLATACAGGDDDAGTGTTESAATAPTSDGVGCEEGFRLIDSEQLVSGTPVCIPETPERIAALTIESTLFAATFDLPLVAYSGFFVDALATSNPELQDELDAMLAGATDVESGTGMSFEALAAAEPDLIYLFDNAGESIDDLPLYDEIAPTVMGTDTADPRERTMFAAEVLGVADEVAAQYAAADDRTAALGELLAGQGATPEISTIGFWDQPEPYVFTDGSGFSYVAILDQADIHVMSDGLTDVATLSLEQLELVDAEKMIVVLARPDSATFLTSLRESAVWQSLDVVQRDDVVEVGGYWFFDTPYDLNKVIDDLFRVVAEVDPAEVSPNPLLDDDA